MHRWLLVLAYILPVQVMALQYGDFKYAVTSSNTVEITDYKGAGGNVVIPSMIASNSVTSIQNGTFTFRRVTAITIGSSVTNIGEWAFSGCYGLTNISVSPDNLTYSDIDGVLFNKEQTELIAFVGGRYDPYTIPKGITKIGLAAFAECSLLEGVTIPESVTSIGLWAFENCSGLASISVAPDNPAYSDIDGVLFDKSQKILIRCGGGKKDTYTIPSGVTRIGDWAFTGCSHLANVNIPDSVTSIGQQAFSMCSGLTNIRIGNGVTDIGDRAFEACSGLTSIHIPNSSIKIGKDVFKGCSGLPPIPK